MADQLTTASKGRLRERMGGLTLADLERIEQAIRIQLGLGV